MFAELFQVQPIPKVYPKFYVHFDYSASVLTITMDDELGKLTCWSHPYDELVVKLPFAPLSPISFSQIACFIQVSSHPVTIRLPWRRKQ